MNRIKNRGLAELAHAATLMAVIVLFGTGRVARAVDTPVPTQGPGEHSTITTSDGSIRDDVLADWVCSRINAAGGTVKDVKIIAAACYGGGMLDDFQRVFGPGGACAGTPWVGGSSSTAEQTAKGYTDDQVASAGNAGKNLGSAYTSALAGPESSHSSAEDGSMRDRTTDNVLEDFEAAKDRDAAGPNGTGAEDPVAGSGNGGDTIGWDDPDTFHEAVVFGGAQTDQRHHNNVDNVTDALNDIWGADPLNDINTIDGGTTQDLLDAIDLAAQSLTESTQLILYLNDHGNTEFDLDEFLDLIMPWSIIEFFQVDFSLHEGWVEGLHAMFDQIGDIPLPTLNLSLNDLIFGDDWQITLNGTDIPLPSGTIPAGDIHLPVDWTSIQTGNNHLEIVAVSLPTNPMQLLNLELSSGPINDSEFTTSAVPTVSHWGIATLALFFMSVGSVVLLRRWRSAA